MSELNRKKITVATRLEEIYGAFRKDPLPLDDLSAFQETSQARGAKIRLRLARVLRNNPDTENLILFYGYKGCGKSTELQKLQSEIQDEFLVVNFSVEDELDPVHLQYIEVFIVTMERLFSAAQEKNIPLSAEFLRNIKNWEQTTEIQTIKDKYNLSVEAEVGADVSIGIPYFHKFFAKFKASAKSSQSLKETLKQVVEPRLSDLIGLCNALLTEIRNNLNDIGLKDLLLIIEDIDKAPLDRAKDLFINYVGQLTQLRCNIIFTFPLALRFTPVFKTIEPYFSDHIELPMIEVRDRFGNKKEDGMKVMRAIAGARMDIKLLEDPAILDDMIIKTGGCLRDYFNLIKEAAENAMDENRATINRTDYDKAYKTLKREYKASIADYQPEGRKDKVTVQDFYNELAKIASNVDKTLPDETDIAMILRQNLMVLGYNGEGWCDVHPVVRDILIERGLLPA
ncbi:MAG: hypothetical protein NTU44_07620 [Bacteroidetes bacterium]|nr:hypothetical protein [Bacteroidota bacterium]